MATLTLQEIAQYRSQLSESSDALVALDELENCEGDLEDAALNLAIQVGQQPDCNDWLAGLAKRHRVSICKFSSELASGQVNVAVTSLTEAKICPPVLVTLMILFVLKEGITEFCEPLSFKLPDNKV